MMKAKIDPDLCGGCGVCVDSAPDVFELVDDLSVCKHDVIPADLEEQAKEGAESCPTEAIELVD